MMYHLPKHHKTVIQRTYVKDTVEQVVIVRTLLQTQQIVLFFKIGLIIMQVYLSVDTQLSHLYQLEQPTHYTL